MNVRMNDQQGILLIKNTHACGRFTDASMLVLGLAKTTRHRHEIIGDDDAAWVMVSEIVSNLWGNWH